MNQPAPSSRWDPLLDLLADEVAQRLQARQTQAAPPTPPPAPPAPPLEAARPPEPELAPEPPAPVLPSHADRILARLALGLLLVVVLINIPFNRHGTTLATAMPDSAALIIRDGLVVKEAGSERIYVYRQGQFRWISSMDAFEHYGFTWGDVHVVEDGFVERFELGAPLHVLLKCAKSPHIYRLEGGQKRWIVDIATFEAEGHEWDDVRFVDCAYLRSLPDGDTVPPGRGPSPQP
ncbi:MAG: hypothetical protein GX605_07495 [Chloroflexi bacterium]|nr:hypothetical protein [Chloroflexota bacterium]